jgi:AraC-like DNA-binding protein
MPSSRSGNIVDPRLVSQPVVSIALEAAFSDISQFNRLFKRRFGATPTAVRLLAARAGPTDCHYNLALLREEPKKPKEAIRHMTQYRRLIGSKSE